MCATEGCPTQPSWPRGGRPQYCLACYLERHPNDPIATTTNRTEALLLSFYEDQGAQFGKAHAPNMCNARAKKVGAWLGPYELDFVLCGRVNDECDGGQHFADVEHFGNSRAADQQARDRDKTLLTLQHGLSVTRMRQVDIWDERPEWQTLKLAQVAFARARAAAGAPVLVVAVRGPGDTAYDALIGLVSADPVWADRVYKVFPTAADPGSVTREHCASGERSVDAAPRGPTAAEWNPPREGKSRG